MRSLVKLYFYYYSIIVNLRISSHMYNIVLDYALSLNVLSNLKIFLSDNRWNIYLHIFVS